MKIAIISFFSFFLSSQIFAATLIIKRDFSYSENKNSQNILGLNTQNYLKAILPNQGGAPSLSYTDGVLSTDKTPIVEPSPKNHTPKELKKKNRFYAVLKGDTVSRIAKKFNVSQDTIIWENNINKSILKIGQELTILPISGISYKVKKGDTLSELAKKYKISISSIKEYNDLTGTLKIGQKLILPGASKKEVALKKVPSKSSKNNSSSKPSKVYLTGDGDIKKYWRKIVPWGKGAKISVPKRRAGRYRYTKTNYGYFTHPAPGTVRTQGIHGNNGIDMGEKKGTKIYAAADGKVIKTSSGGWGGGYGTYILIQHPNETQTMYAHNSKNLVWRGEYVKKGQLIAEMGNTGRSTGNHLHFEVRGAYNPF